MLVEVPDEVIESLSQETGMSPQQLVLRALSLMKTLSVRHQETALRLIKPYDLWW